MNRESIAQTVTANGDLVQIIKHELTDHSDVFSVTIGGTIIDADDELHAWRMFDAINNTTE